MASQPGFNYVFLYCLDAAEVNLLLMLLHYFLDISHYLYVYLVCCLIDPVCTER